MHADLGFVRKSSAVHPAATESLCLHAADVFQIIVKEKGTLFSHRLFMSPCDPIPGYVT